MRFGIVLILLLVSSCAQVGVLGGGENDEFAPKPNLEKMEPKNASTSFNGKEMVIPFDEYIKLNNPSETIIVVPPNIKPTAKIKKKSLVISWEEELLPNTTYAFYLNGTVQDTKESNDSLMSFVFSTGTYIDSLTAEFSIRDAFTNEPLKGYIIGLYESYSDTIRPTYFSQTDAQGKAILSYLKPGKYEIGAFLDKNKDLKHQADEPFGYKKDALLLSKNSVDSIPIRTYSPQQKPKITSVKFNPPGSFVVAANRSLKGASFVINGKGIPSDYYVYYTNDSLLLPFQTSDTSRYTIITQTVNWTDTTSIRITQKEKGISISLNFEKSKEILPNKPITLISSSEVKQLVAPLILVQDAKDSSNLIIRSLNSLGNRIELNFDRENVSSANLIFLPGAIEGFIGTNVDTLLLKIDCLTSKDVGNMDVDISAFEETVILELLMGTKVIESIPMTKSVRKHPFKNLKPGEYTFRFIYDENENGRWDVGNRDLKIQPEFVEVFSEKQKVRANWDLEVVLKKAEDGEIE